MTQPNVGVSIFASLLLAGGLWSQEAGEQGNPTCVATRFAGEVGKEQAFEKEFGPGLLFRLKPERHPANPQGWTIEVRSKANPEHDYLLVATPPYRSSNPRYLDTAYGMNARQAVEWSPRGFSFVLTEQDYQKLSDALEFLLWPGNYSSQQVKTAEKEWKEILAKRSIEGRLRILDSRIGSTGPEDEVGWIEHLKFEVELCVPAESQSSRGRN